MAIELAEDNDYPFFVVNEQTITHRNPKVITDGITVCQEAYIEMNTTNMTQGFLKLLMWHLGEGNIRVKIAEKKQA